MKELCKVHSTNWFITKNWRNINMDNRNVTRNIQSLITNAGDVGGGIDDTKKGDYWTTGIKQAVLRSGW